MWSSDAFPILRPEDVVFPGDEAFQDLWSLDSSFQIPPLPRAITPEIPMLGKKPREVGETYL